VRCKGSFNSHGREIFPANPFCPRSAVLALIMIAVQRERNN